MVSKEVEECVRINVFVHSVNRADSSIGKSRSIAHFFQSPFLGYCDLDNVQSVFDAMDLWASNISVSITGTWLQQKDRPNLHPLG